MSVFDMTQNYAKDIKTVELIVGTVDWSPPPPTYSSETLVPLLIKVSDMTSRTLAKAVSGIWNPLKQLWYVKYSKIAGTALEKHIYVDDS